MKIIKHINSGQTKVFEDKIADTYLKSPSWVEVKEKTKPKKSASTK